MPSARPVSASAAAASAPARPTLSAPASSSAAARSAARRAAAASAAAAPQSTPVRRPSPRAAMALRSSVTRVRWERVGRIALLVVLLVVVYLYGERTLSYLTTHARASRERAAVVTLERQNRALEQRARALRDPATILELSRRLGMVRPGEQSYAIVPSSRR